MPSRARIEKGYRKGGYWRRSLSFSAHLDRSHGPVSEKHHSRGKKKYLGIIFADILWETLAYVLLESNRNWQNLNSMPKDNDVRWRWSFLLLPFRSTDEIKSGDGEVNVRPIPDRFAGSVHMSHRLGNVNIMTMTQVRNLKCKSSGIACIWHNPQDYSSWWC